MKNKNLALLLGHHIGDSLGLATEFQQPLEKEDWIKDITGNKKLGWEKGEGSDDTLLSIITLKSITKNNTFDHDLHKQLLIEFMDSDPKDIGETTKKSISRLKQGLIPQLLHNEPNGSLMRIAPLSLINLPEEDMEKLIRQVTISTHNEPLCVRINQYYIKALKFAFKSPLKSDLIKYCLHITNNHPEVNKRLKTIPSITYEEISNSGYVLDGLFNALWSLYHYENFEESILAIANKGDDSDTNGAIAGALLGAFYGLDNIPARFIEPLWHKNEYQILLKERKLL